MAQRSCKAEEERILIKAARTSAAALNNIIQGGADTTKERTQSLFKSILVAVAEDLKKLYGTTDVSDERLILLLPINEKMPIVRAALLEIIDRTMHLDHEQIDKYLNTLLSVEFEE